MSGYTKNTGGQHAVFGGFAIPSSVTVLLAALSLGVGAEQEKFKTRTLILMEPRNDLLGVSNSRFVFKMRQSPPQIQAEVEKGYSVTFQQSIFSQS